MEHPLPETQIPQLDKLLHAVEFGALCFLLIRALKGSFTGLSGFRLLAFAVILTTIYGATDEIHQLFVPGRVSSFIDLFFDFLGALAVGFLKR
ncbi:MAG: VanZ family protein [Candidatus Omnitrophota bacterium]|jgi:VanZ family protein